jgi:hypothetical protein
MVHCTIGFRDTYHPWLKTIDAAIPPGGFHFGRSPLEGFWLSQSKPDITFRPVPFVGPAFFLAMNSCQ